MMHGSGRFHSMCAAMLMVVLGLIGWGTYESNGRYQAAALVEALDNAKEDVVLKTVEKCRPYWRWARPLLVPRLEGDPKTVAEEADSCMLA